MGVGIDIGAKTIKVVELEKRGDKFALKASGVVGYTGQPPEFASNEKDLGQLSAIVKKLLRESKVTRKDVAISIPEHEVFTRTVRFPPLTDQEIASAVKWEAEQYIPIPVSEAILQHQITDRQETATKPYVSVFLVAVSKEIANRYVKVVQDAGATVGLVEPTMMALARSLAPKDKTVLIVDIGSYSSNMAVVRGQKLVFSRSIPTAGNALTRAVGQALSIDPVQSEEYKKSYGLAKDRLEGKVRQSMLPVVGVITDEIKKALQFYKSEEGGSTPATIYLSGGSSGLPGLISELSASLNLEVVLGNPFQDVTLSPQEQKSIAAYSSLYSTALGLAKS
jgi:type IV pilus assembly protein PilM